MLAYYLSSLLAFTGGHMINYTVILYLQDKVGSDLLSGVGFGLSFGSSIVFGWFAGVLCDRVAPHRVIHAAHGLFMLCLTGLWWTDAAASDQTRVAAVLLSAFLGGLAWSFVGPARLASLGQLVPPERLKPASILFNLQVLIGFGLAPLLIGLLRSRYGWPAVFAVGLGLFVAASLMLWGVRTRGSLHASQGVWADMAQGFGTVRANPLLLQLVLAAIMAFAMTGPMQILLPKLAKDVLALNELQRGAYLGMMALALIVGGVGALVLGKHVPPGKAILAGTATASLLFATLSCWTNPLASAAALGGMAVLGGMVISLVVAGIQGQAPPELRGRVMALYSIISQVVPAASGVLAGAMVRANGLLPSLWMAGLGLAGLAVLGALCMPQLRQAKA